MHTMNYSVCHLLSGVWGERDTSLVLGCNQLGCFSTRNRKLTELFPVIEKVDDQRAYSKVPAQLL